TIVPSTSRTVAAASSVITLLPIMSPFLSFLFPSTSAIRLHLHFPLHPHLLHQRFLHVLLLLHAQLCGECAASAVASVGYFRAGLGLLPAQLVARLGDWDQLQEPEQPSQPQRPDVRFLRWAGQHSE